MKPKIESKRWNKDFEHEILKRWIESNPFAFDPKKPLPVFSIDTPPPYVNAPVHVGHATVYTIMDMIARYKRMRGFNVLFPLGLDRNGLPIEVATEKMFNVSMSAMGREEFLELCKKLLDNASTKSVEVFKRLGISFHSYDFGKGIEKAYLTDSEDYRAATQATFIELWKKGMIYKDKRVNNYCLRCRTTIADSEIKYEEEKGKLNYIKFTVKETGEEITIATTRPELLCTCAMVIFNPSDDRYRHLEGKHAIIPVYEREVPIKAHPYAKPEFGTGLVMMCSYGDYTDIRFFRENGLKERIAIEKDGRMNEEAGLLKGLKVEEARNKIIEILREKNLLVKTSDCRQRKPVCERCGGNIEFIALEEYYLKQLEMKDEMLKIANELNFFSEESRQILIDWINSVSMDWAISRRRYYATEIPLWYCKKCGYTYVPEGGKYYRPWKENPPIESCPACGSKEFEGEKRVFDTWFDSSISPLCILGYFSNPEFFKRNPVCTLRPQGKEIIRTWLYYTLLRCKQLTGKKIFRDVWIHFHVVDEKGKKMSKSKGNVLDPNEIIAKHGAEPFRLWCALEGDITKTDLRCSLERIEAGSKFLTKLWNISRFISMFDFDERWEVKNESDVWILNELNKLISFVEESYENYNFHRAIKAIRNFLWHKFADHYIELVKGRAYNSDGKFSEANANSARLTLNLVLINSLKLLHPIVPFITTKIYEEIYGKDISKESFPHKIPVRASKVSSSLLMDVNSKIWKAKKEKGKSLSSEVNSCILPEGLKSVEEDLVEMHRINLVRYWKKRDVSLSF